jgi:hypothetical protein
LSFATRPEKPGEWQSRIAWLGGLLNMARSDLSEQTRGGRVILVHGLADQIMPPGSSVDYYSRLVVAMGQNTVSEFLKFLRGRWHGPQRLWDRLQSELECAWCAGRVGCKWGVIPVDPVVQDIHFKPGVYGRAASIRRGRSIRGQATSSRRRASLVRGMPRAVSRRPWFATS